MTDPQMQREARIAELLEKAAADLRAGRAVDPIALRTRYPDCADDLPALLETMRAFDTAVEDWKMAATLAEDRVRAVPHEDEPLPGTIGRYRILERLGAGGMGTVYKARDPKLDKTLVSCDHFGMQFWDPLSGRPRGRVLGLRDGQALFVSPEGHYHGTPQIERQLVYVVQTDRGQETLSPAEFAQKYKWKNDPSRVGLLDK